MNESKIMSILGAILIILLMWSVFASTGTRAKVSYYDGMNDGTAIMAAVLDGMSSEEAYKKYDKYHMLYERKKEKEKE